jgi:hypothetical protein
MRSFSGWPVSAKLEGRRFAAAHLIARVHVDAPTEAVVDAAIFLVVAILSGHGQTASTGQLLRCSAIACCAVWCGANGAAAASARRQRRGNGRTERGARLHSPIRCHRNHWSSRTSREASRARERRLISCVVFSRRGDSCRIARGRAGHGTGADSGQFAVSAGVCRRGTGRAAYNRCEDGARKLRARECSKSE